MSRKDFQKGMEAGARPFEEKFAKQSEEFKKTSDSINKKLDGLNRVTDVIISELNGMQKKELYDLNTVVDIGKLGGDEKELLMAVLYTLANMTDYVTEGQQAFIRSVKSYLGIKEVQTNVDLSCIENIESINDQKAILQTVMEFLFIENQNHDYMDEYSDVMEYFSVNNKTIKQIQNCINQIFNATGIQGLIEMYGYVPPAPPKTVKSENNEEDYSEPYIEVCEKCADIMGSYVLSRSDIRYCDMGEYYVAYHKDEETYFFKVNKSDGKTEKFIIDNIKLRHLIKMDATRIIAADQNVFYIIDCDSGKLEQEIKLERELTYNSVPVCNADKIFYEVKIDNSSALCEYDIKNRQEKMLKRNDERITSQSIFLIGTKLYINNMYKLFYYDYATEQFTDVCPVSVIGFLSPKYLVGEVEDNKTIALIKNEIIQFYNEITDYSVRTKTIYVMRLDLKKLKSVKLETIPGYYLVGATINDEYLYYIEEDSSGAIGRYNLITGEKEEIVSKSYAVGGYTEGIFRKRRVYFLNDCRFDVFGNWIYYCAGFVHGLYGGDNNRKINIKEKKETVFKRQKITEIL